MASLDSILNRRRPTVWERFLSSPTLFIARLVYSPSFRPPTYSDAADSNSVRVVCISDTHNTHSSQPSLPPGDILIHSGDLTNSGTMKEIDDALSWLSSQPHPYKVFITGNHDSILVSSDTHRHIASTYPSLIYLQDSSTELMVRNRTIRIYGSPHTPKHGSWEFQYPRVHSSTYTPLADDQTKDHQPSPTKIWSSIPLLTDILVTHGPPFAHLDLDRTGCYALLFALWRIRPQLHVFGHIHAARGIEHIVWDRTQSAYEDLLAGRVYFSFWGLMRLVWWSVVERVRSRFLVGWWRLGMRDRGTILVNAASIGGTRDDRKLGAILVDI